MLSKFSRPITCILTLTVKKIILAQDFTILLSILPFVKSNGKARIVITPKMMVQNTVANTNQKKRNYFISLIPINSAAESENLILPSWVWYVSKSATISLGVASPEPFNVCKRLTFLSSSLLYLIFPLLDWKSSKLLQDETSSHCFSPGDHISIS